MTQEADQVRKNDRHHSPLLIVKTGPRAGRYWPMSIIISEIDVLNEVPIMNWSVADAKQQLSEVLRRAASRPQTITKRSRDIAVVVDVEEFRAFQQWKSSGKRKTVAEALAELSLASGSHGPALKAPRRRNRRAQFIPPAA